MTPRNRALLLSISAALLACALLWWVWPGDPLPRAEESTAVWRTRGGAVRKESGAKAERAKAKTRPAPGAAVIAESDMIDQMSEALVDTEVHSLKCAVEPNLPREHAYFHTDLVAELPPSHTYAIVLNGTAFLHAPTPRGRGLLNVDGFAPVDVSWDGDRCTPEPIRLEPSKTAITGTVFNAEGEPEGRVVVHGCSNRTVTAVDGSWYLPVRPYPCEVVAHRHDGALVARSEVVEVTPVAGQDTVVNLTLPPVRRGGIGAVVQIDPDGVRILDVLDDSSSAEAGLQSGDLIVEVDGISTTDLDLGEFVELVGGDAGTSVGVVLLRATERVTIELDRRAVSTQ